MRGAGDARLHALVERQEKRASKVMGHVEIADATLMHARLTLIALLDLLVCHCACDVWLRRAVAARVSSNEDVRWRERNSCDNVVANY